MTRSERNPEPDQGTEKPTAIEFHSVSKWYGHVIGVNNLTLRVAAGVTGLLGPNGAGKSTLLQLATGQLRPSQGEVRVLGHRPWNNAGLNRLIGLCPEQDAFFEWMTGREFLTSSALLAGLGRRGSRRRSRIGFPRGPAVVDARARRLGRARRNHRPGQAAPAAGCRGGIGAVRTRGVDECLLRGYE